MSGWNNYIVSTAINITPSRLIIKNKPTKMSQFSFEKWETRIYSDVFLLIFKCILTLQLLKCSIWPIFDEFLWHINGNIVFLFPFIFYICLWCLMKKSLSFMRFWNLLAMQLFGWRFDGIVQKKWKRYIRSRRMDSEKQRKIKKRLTSFMTNSQK